MQKTDETAALGSKRQTTLLYQNSIMSSATPHRIDPPSFAVPHVDGGRRPIASSSQQDTVNLDESLSAGDNSPSLLDKNSPPQAGELSAEAVAEGRERPASDFHRIDASHPSAEEATDEIPRPEQWLRLQASDLIDRLQTWATELDAREAQLNARSAVQDHRERHFRMQQQDLAAEMAEQQRSIERQRAEIQSRARRLAFADTPESSP